MLPNYRGQEKLPEKYSIEKEYWGKGGGIGHVEMKGRGPKEETSTRVLVGT